MNEIINFYKEEKDDCPEYQYDKKTLFPDDAGNVGQNVFFYSRDALIACLIISSGGFYGRGAHGY